MFSAPAPIATSASPSIRHWAADTMACKPEPHSRSTLNAGTLSGMPAFRVATRDRYMSRGSVLMTWPKTTWPTAAAGTPVRSSTARTTVSPSSHGGTSFRPPPKSPTAVRHAPTMTMSCMMMLLWQAPLGATPIEAHSSALMRPEIEKIERSLYTQPRREGQCMDDRFSLAGRTALVTGASGGLGTRFARTLGLAGATVILAGRHREA